MLGGQLSCLNKPMADLGFLFLLGGRLEFVTQAFEILGSSLAVS